LVPSTESREPGVIYRYPLAVLGEQILVETPLVGRHQLRNVALAVAAAVEVNSQGFVGITAESIERGIRETRWPGRFQVIAARAGWPEMVIDVAHNPAGAWALRSALSERYEDRPLIFVFGAMRDKAISEMTEILFPLAERVIATRPENPRAASPEEIQQAAARTGVEVEAVEDVQSAVERARSVATTGTVVVVTGSIYLVGEVMGSIGAEV
jgi:dihydrofolate synthase/folylpolyglutamate synthase